MKNAMIEDLISLPVEKRAELIDILIKSLNPPSDGRIDKLWAKEAERRLADIKKGKVKTVPAEDVFNRIRNRLSQ